MILIKDAQVNGKETDILIDGNTIRAVVPSSSCTLPTDCRVINARGKVAIPGFVNAHTHAAMTHFRGYGDDMALMPWLEQKIWPNEVKMTDDDVYWGARLACLEMIKTGTTTFFDMYQRPAATARAVEEMGLRAVLSLVCFDHFNTALAERARQQITTLYAQTAGYSSRIRFALGPHAIYTVSGGMLQWIDAFSREHGLMIHLHLAETAQEVSDSLERFGLTPVRYLKKLGVLSPRLMLAHGIYIDDDELQLLADHGVGVAHNPASNMKLASGLTFKFDEMRRAGIRVGIGTDGCGSSNNLDMVEAMRLAAFLGKAWRNDPEAVKAADVLQAATADGAAIAGLNTGRIEPGYLADLCLIDLAQPALVPNFNFTSNLVYSANGNCIDTVICDGKVVMENRIVPGEKEIMERAAQAAYRLMAD